MSGSYNGRPFGDDPPHDLMVSSQRLQRAREDHQRATAALYAAEQEMQFHIGRLIGAMTPVADTREED